MTHDFDFIVDGEIVCASMAEAAETIGCSPAAISKALKLGKASVMGHTITHRMRRVETIVRYAMIKADLAPKDLIEKSGLSSRVVYDVLRHGIQPTTSIGTLYKLAVALDTDMESLLDF